MAQSPVYAVVNGRTINVYFGDGAFNNPGVCRKPTISRIVTENGERTVHFIDGTFVKDVDHIIFGTGYSWSLPFLPHVEIRNNRVPGVFEHVVYQKDPTLLFVGAVSMHSSSTLRSTQTNTSAGRSRSNLQDLRMASRASSSSSRRPSYVTSSRGATEVGGRPRSKERRQASLHNNIPRLRRLFRGRETYGWTGCRDESAAASV